MSSQTPQEHNFQLACTHLGSGDPGSPERPGLWFVGLEEALGWRSEEHLKRYGGVPFVLTTRPEENLGERRELVRIYMWISKIACGLSERYTRQHWPTVWPQYMEQMLFYNASRVCQTNLFPLGRPNRTTKFPEHFRHFFGYGEPGTKYVDDTKEKRFPVIQEWRRNCQPQAIVCFGESGWPFHRELFDLPERSPDTNGVCLYEAEKIMLIPFLGLRGGRAPMSDRDVDLYINQLRRWSVKVT